MKGWFLKADNQLWEKAVEFAAGPHAHMELQFSDGIFFSSTLDLGPRFTTLDKLTDTDVSHWDVVEIEGATLQDEATVRILAEMIAQGGLQGRPQTYSLKNIFLDFLPAPIDTQTPNQWICSQACTYVLQSIGLFLGYIPQELSPDAAYQILKAEFPAWGALRFRAIAP